MLLEGPQLTRCVNCWYHRNFPADASKATRFPNPW